MTIDRLVYIIAIIIIIIHLLARDFLKPIFFFTMAWISVMYQKYFVDESV
jgi:hypothetical protein